MPLHHYFQQALTMMYDHLKHLRLLPPSQVVDTVPRGLGADGAAVPVSLANLPPLSFDPPEHSRVTFAPESGRLTIGSRKP